MSNLTLPGLAQDTQIEYRVVRVTPEMAAAWLTHNVANRTISAATVEQYASDMRHGWPFTGQPITFDSDGRLIDGQHRLTAQVKADVVIEWLVITGVTPGTQDYIDIGRPRTVANQLQIKGVTFSNAIAAVARLDLVYSGEKHPSKPAIRERAEKDVEAFAKSGHLGRSVAQTLGASSASYSLAHYRMAQLDEVAADQFFESLASGADLAHTDPILVARTAIYRMHKGSARSWNDASRCAFADYLFKAWNLWRAGKRVKAFSRPTSRVEPK